MFVNAHISSLGYLCCLKQGSEMNGFRLSKKSRFGGTKLPFNPPSPPPRVLSRSPDLAAVTIVTRFLRNYPLPHSYQNNKTENIKAQVKPYSFDRRQFFFFWISSCKRSSRLYCTLKMIARLSFSIDGFSISILVICWLI